MLQFFSTLLCWVKTRNKSKATGNWAGTEAGHSPTEVQFSKVNDLPPPALGSACVVSATWVMLSGAEGAEVAAAAVAQGEQQVPGGPQVSGELQPHWVSRGAVSGAANVDLGAKTSNTEGDTGQTVGLPIILHLIQPAPFGMVFV